MSSSFAGSMRLLPPAQRECAVAPDHYINLEHFNKTMLLWSLSAIKNTILLSTKWQMALAVS